MEPWLQAAVVSVASIVASSGFWAFITNKSNARTATDRLLMGLAYDKIAQLGMSYIERGWISKDEYEEYRKYLYEPYKELGGNGVAERIMADVALLPLKSYSRYSEIIQVNRGDR